MRAGTPHYGNTSGGTSRDKRREPHPDNMGLVFTEFHREKYTKLAAHAPEPAGPARASGIVPGPALAADQRDERSATTGSGG